MEFVNPKIGARRDPVDDWYRYYAGYSAAFVESALANIAPEATTILDPWNGTGTTTVVAANRQVVSYGYDVNPALVVISRARLLGMGVWASISPLTDDLIHHAQPATMEDDPLSFWFTPAAASVLRGLQLSIHRLLVDSGSVTQPAFETASRASTLAAFFYTVLFRTVRVLIAPTAGTNPTWWKKVEDDALLDPDRGVILAHFKVLVKELEEGLHRDHFDTRIDTTVEVGDSRSLTLPDDSIDAVVSSPPYCTRIDYGVATRPELAALGAGEDWMKQLRKRMVGTPTMTGETGDPQQWGGAASSFLTAVSGHASKASKGYYSNYFHQYYTGMWASLGELRRVTKQGGPVVLVVQDNHYKELHNDTPGILAEMALRRGFDSAERHDFVAKRNRAIMNPGARRYRDRAGATESIVVLQ